jgi:hypothetical protein
MNLWSDPKDIVSNKQKNIHNVEISDIIHYLTMYLPFTFKLMPLVPFHGLLNHYLNFFIIMLKEFYQENGNKNENVIHDVIQRKLNGKNVYNHSVQNPFFFFSMPLMLEDCRVRVVQNKALRRIIIHVKCEMVNV